MESLVNKLKNKKTAVLRRSIEKKLSSFRYKSVQDIPIYLKNELPDPKFHVLKQAIRSKGDKDIPPGSFFLEILKKAPRKDRRRRKKGNITNGGRNSANLCQKYKQLFAEGDIDLRPMSRVSTSLSSHVPSVRNLSHSQNCISSVRSSSKLKSNRLINMSFMSQNQVKQTKDQIISSVQKTIKKFNSRYYRFNKDANSVLRVKS